MSNSIAFNEDCMVGMSRYEDKFFDLAVVDPPYGNDLSGSRTSKNGFSNKVDWDKARNGWNLKIPDINYFKELQRVSKNQVIWGGNYFANLLQPSECWLVWDKGQRNFSFADGELAWTSYDKAMRIKTIYRQAARQEGGVHPTQKPSKLYAWIYEMFAVCKECNNTGEIPSLSIDCDVQTCPKCKGNVMKILDTHLGSGSSRIAAYKAGLDFTGFEIDRDYFLAQEKRFKTFTDQLSIL